MKLQMGEDKQMRRQTNTKDDHRANAGARDVHQVVRETTKGGRRPEESKLFKKKKYQETSETEQQLDPSCYQSSSHFSDR